MIRLLVSIDTDLNTDDDLEQYAEWVSEALDPFSVLIQSDPMPEHGYAWPVVKETIRGEH